MTMPNKRLEYEPLKVVLQNLEPNLRIQLALRILSIRTVEKAVPMKIEHLASKDNKIVINDTTYRVGIHCQYPNPAQTPWCHQETNERAELGWEIDQWGFRTDDDPVMTAGDLDLRSARGIWTRRNLEEHWTRGVVITQEGMRRLIARDGFEFEGMIPEYPNYELITSQNELKIEEASRVSFDILRNLLSIAQREFLPYYYQKNNILPPYTPLIQLTIDGPEGKHIERVARSKKLFEAMKYLNTRFFGGRRHPIHVKELSFVPYSYPHRLPSDMRIRVRQIQSYSVDFKKLKNLIVLASYPLEVLTLESYMQSSNNFNHNVVRSAKKLVIHNYCRERQSWIPVVQNMKNKCIILKYQTEMHEPQHFIDLIEHWLESERTKGTELTIGFRQQETVTELLELIKTQFEIIKMSERSLTLPMKNGSRLLVSCEPVAAETEELRNRAGFAEVEEEKKSKWSLRLIVV